MEEDIEEITGWEDNEDKFLNYKIVKKHKKKMTHSVVIDEELIERKLKPSRTLPFIKNKPTYEQSHTDQTEKPESTYLDKLQRMMQERTNKNGKAIILKEYLDSLEKVNTSQMTTKSQLKSQSEVQQQKQQQQELNISIQKKLGQVKLGSTIVKGQKIPQKISYLEKLKIQTSDYKSTPRNLSPADAQKTQKLRKINRNSLANSQKKEKNKYFIVKKQRLSPEKQSEEVLKMAVESRKSSDEQIRPETRDRKSYVMKQKYHDIIKKGEKYPILMKCQSQQLRNGAHARKTTENEIRKSVHKNEQKMRECKQASFQGYVGIKDPDVVKSRKLNKWAQVLKEVENEEKTLKKLKEHQKKLIKAAKKESITLLPNFNQKIQMLEMMITKRIRNDILKVDQAMISTLKKTLMKELTQIENYRREKTLPSQENPASYDQFSDECLFYNRNRKENKNEEKNV